MLLIGVDSPIGLTVLRELGARGLEVVCVGRGRYSLGRASKFCHRFLERPEGPIADWLEGLVKAYQAIAVMAVSEGDLLQLAALKHAIPGCTIAVPDSAKLALVLDKPATLAAARAAGIQVPETWQPVADEDLASSASRIAYPVAIKWADPTAIVKPLEAAGIAFEKVEYADDPASLLAILRRYDAYGAYPLVQTYCPGYGLGQMFNMAGGRATLRFQHRRLREWPVTGGVSSFCGSVALDKHSDQLAKSEELLRSIGWEGPAMVEYRYDPATGNYWLMEINGRFWGSIPLAHHAGAHFGWEAYRTLVARENAQSTAQLRPRKARFMVPDLKHLVSRLRESQTGVLAKLALVAGFFLAFVDPEISYYVWSSGDPGPFVSDMKSLLRKAARLDS
ncbi:carboxylate--amine ligase [Parerythrobacter lacustris]|uniref:Carboxylate--amine ligase n=1 Tax=Parerythrobacter lacustris TaxID=2969984 RepID=A0ABT1XNZ8_9SPHN|nr:carboxylate--amine ligase [Parerythrobacter lacustris]